MIDKEKLLERLKEREQENKWACPYNNEECEKCHLCTECITKEKEQENIECGDRN